MEAAHAAPSPAWIYRAEEPVPVVASAIVAEQEVAPAAMLDSVAAPVAAAKQETASTHARAPFKPGLFSGIAIGLITLSFATVGTVGLVTLSAATFPMRMVTKLFTRR